MVEWCTWRATDTSESGVRITLQRLFSIWLGGRVIPPRDTFFFTGLSFLFLYSFLPCFFFFFCHFSLKFDLNFFSERIYFTTLFCQSVYFSLFVELCSLAFAGASERFQLFYSFVYGINFHKQSTLIKLICAHNGITLLVQGY